MTRILYCRFLNQTKILVRITSLSQCTSLSISDYQLVIAIFFLLPCHSEQKMPEGSWTCEKCNNVNYPFRTKCNRQNCGADKPTEPNKSPSVESDENDQVCCSVDHSLCVAILHCLEPLLLMQTFVCILNLIKFQVHAKMLVEWIYWKILIFSVHLDSLQLQTVTFYFILSPLHSLICNYLLFQWVLGHVWGLRRSRVVIQHCSIRVSDCQSCRPLCCSSCQVSRSHDLCQIVY